MVMLRSSIVALAMVVSIAAVDPVRQIVFPSDSELAARAYKALDGGQEQDALAIYSEAIRLRPDNYMSYYRRGVTLADQGQLEPALADLDAAVRLSPVVKTSNELGIRAWNSLLPETHALHTVILVRSARSDVLRGLNRPRDAIVDLDAAIALDPRRTSVWYKRAVLHMEMGNAPAAVADFSALLARRENSEWRFARGMGHFVNGDLAEAEADFIKATKMDPKNALYGRWLLKTQKARGVPI
jgi:tetratricopeptide (TPR) repeat protein